MNDVKPIALVIDDEIQLRRLLDVSLTAEGYRVFQAQNGSLGLVEAASRKPDIIILDLGLPDMDGNEVIQRLREWSSTPIVVLSVRDTPDEKVAALDAGADDYVTKPFHTAELLARLRVAQRHAIDRENPTSLIEIENLQIDLRARSVLVDQKPVSLTPTEYGVLRLLATHSGKVLTREFLLRNIWGPKNTEQSQYLRVYVSHLRSKLTEAGLRSDLIKTETGIGYRLLAKP